MKYIFIFLNLLGLCIMPRKSFSAESINIPKILEYADRTRGGIPEGLEWTVKLNSVEEEEKTEREFFIKFKNNDSYVESTAPQKYKGEVFLFKGRSMWYFKPGLRAPISISSRQKLSGTASNGDIASTNYNRDYNATFIKMDSLQNEPCYQFLLKAKSNDTTYDQINYWISKKTGLAVKAEFLSLSGGKVLKTATFKYESQITYQGHKFPFITEMTITNEKNKNNKSTLVYSVPQVKSLPDSLFNVNNLKR